MALTAKPISTISYNTENFLLDLLNRLLKVHKIDDFRYIKHIGEKGDKDHIHIWIQPSRRIDTSELKDMFNEIDITSAKPLGVLPFRPSNTYHWIRYAVHDASYLRLHSKSDDGDGKIPYRLNEIVTPYIEQLERDYRSSAELCRSKNADLIDALARGENVLEILYGTETSIWDAKNMMEIMRLYQAKNGLTAGGTQKAVAELSMQKNEEDPLDTL